MSVSSTVTKKQTNKQTNKQMYKQTNIYQYKHPYKQTNRHQMLILRLPKRVDNTDGRGQEIHLLLPLSEGILFRENKSSTFLHL